MADKKRDPSLPSDGWLLDNWLTTTEAAEIMQMDTSSVRYLCINHKIRCAKIPGAGRGGGAWRIDPESARQHIRRKPSGED